MSGLSDTGAQDCHFCDALHDRVAAEPRAFDDGQFAVFMGRYQPTGPGYVLVVPYPHVRDLHALREEDCGAMLQMVRRVSAAVQQTFDVSGTTVMQNNGRPGQSVMHLHFHVVPRWPGDGYPRSSAAPEPDASLQGQAVELAASLAQAPSAGGRGE